MVERVSTWDSIGTVVDGATTTSQVLEQADLKFNVVKKPLYVVDGNKQILVPGKVATVRDDTDQILGVVSDNYQICQNESAFDFIDTVSSDITFVKAGMTQTGLIYIIGKLPETTVLGDTFTPYLIFQTSHNGRYTLKTTICPLRIVCNNQFATAFRNSPNTISIQHSAQLTTKMAQAVELLSDTATYMKNFTNTAEELALLRVGNDANVQSIINSFFDSTKEITERQKRLIEESKTQFITAYNSDDNANFRGTAWGMINGFTDYLTHKSVKKTSNADENKFMRVTFDNTLLQNFMNHVMANVV